MLEVAILGSTIKGNSSLNEIRICNIPLLFTNGLKHDYIFVAGRTHNSQSRSNSHKIAVN